MIVLATLRLSLNDTCAHLVGCLTKRAYAAAPSWNIHKRNSTPPERAYVTVAREHGRRQLQALVRPQPPVSHGRRVRSPRSGAAQPHPVARTNCTPGRAPIRGINESGTEASSTGLGAWFTSTTPSVRKAFLSASVIARS